MSLPSRPRILRVACLSLALVTPLSASGAAQEIIIETRSKASYGCGDLDLSPPAVLYRKRADHVVQRLVITDDTRQPETRRAEIEAALAGLEQAAAADGTVNIALVAETADELEFVRPFSRTRALASIEDGPRPDTSQVQLLAKTAVTDTDGELSVPAARIASFLKRVRLPGRVLIEPKDEPSLSLVDPEQYRPAVIAAIAADLRAITSALGPEYAGRLERLERPLAWTQLDELELGIYLPYLLTVER